MSDAAPINISVLRKLRARASIGTVPKQRNSSRVLERASKPLLQLWQATLLVAAPRHMNTTDLKRRILWKRKYKY